MSADFTIEEIAQRCAEENQKFSQQQDSNPRFCLELLRRALVDNIPDALTEMVRIFERQVLAWVYRHPQFEQAGESTDYFVNAAFANFYFAMRGGKFAEFSTLRQALTYLKLCVHTAVAQYVRDQELPAEPLPDEDYRQPTYTANFDGTIDEAELWNHICRLLPAEEDRLLANCTFIQELKPAQIVLLYPAQWPQERTVSVALQRIRRILRNDRELRERAGIP